MLTSHKKSPGKNHGVDEIIPGFSFPKNPWRGKNDEHLGISIGYLKGGGGYH